jgi:PTH1 family peptidyl-tRNA hydrolase
VKLIVGLGNPGIEYQFTWHNLGFLTVDRLAEQLGVRVDNRRCRALTGSARMEGQELLLAKPETYMNLSGSAVQALVGELQADPARDLLVVYDELDLPLGVIRVRQRGGAGGHHGMESIIGALNTQEFARVRLGISPAHKVEDGARYVLSPIRKVHYTLVDGMLDTAAEAVTVAVAQGTDAAMNRFNRKLSDSEIE